MRGQADPNSSIIQCRSLIQFVLAGVLILIAVFTAVADEAQSSTNSTPSHRPLIIAPSTASFSGGKATLTLGKLRFETNAYVGEFQMKVNPFFFKNEKGRLSIEAPEESVNKLKKGIPVDFIGKSVSTGSGRIRTINGTATPTNANEGTVTLWFTASGKKLTFNTTYRFEAKEK